MFSTFLLIIFLSWSQVICQETPALVSETNNKTVESYYDYILKFSFDLNEEKVPTYFVDLIYNESEAIITTDDVLNLFKVKTMSLSETQVVVDKMNVSRKVLNMEGFDGFLTELDVNFKDIYDKVTTKLNISGAALREFLIDLGIDADTFSSAIAFSSSDPYIEFKKGNFSEASVLAALTKVGKTQAELFAAIRDEFVVWANLKPKATIVQKLNKYNFGTRSALSLWSVLNLTLDNVRQIPNFDNMITSSFARWNNISVLGILTGPYEAMVNVAGHAAWRDDPLVLVFAESFSNKTKVQIRWVVRQPELPNIVKLSCANMNISSEVVAYAVPAVPKEFAISNCSFVTVINGSLVSEVIPESHNHESEVHAVNNTIVNSEVILGSPLICDNSVFGLAREINTSMIVFDTFYEDHSIHGGSISITNFNTFGYSVFLGVLFCYILWVQ